MVSLDMPKPFEKPRESKTKDSSVWQKVSPKEQSSFPTSWEQIMRKGGVFITANLFGTTPATAANYEVFFTAERAMDIMEVTETHRVAGTDAGAVSLNLEILDPGEALDAGDTVLSTAFNLKSTINTPVTYSGTNLTSTRTLKPGQRLALKDSGTLTAVAGLSVTVYLRFAGKGDFF
jgi:hypothetical protein